MRFVAEPGFKLANPGPVIRNTTYSQLFTPFNHLCLSRGFTAQSTQWGRYVKRGQLTKPHFLLGRLSPLKRLTLNMPRKPASENVVCLCRLLNILANYFCIEANRVDPDLEEQSDLGLYCLQKQT